MGRKSVDNIDASLGDKMRLIFDSLHPSTVETDTVTFLGERRPHLIAPVNGRAWTFERFVEELDTNDVYTRRLVRLMAYVSF